MNEFDCMYYDKEFDCCGFETDYGQPMPIFKPCHETICKRKKPRPLLQKPKRTNFDKITESVESLAEFLGKKQMCYFCPIYKDYKMCKCQSTDVCEKNLKEWLQKECEDEN